MPAGLHAGGPAAEKRDLRINITGHDTVGLEKGDRKEWDHFHLCDGSRIDPQLMDELPVKGIIFELVVKYIQRQCVEFIR